MLRHRAAVGLAGRAARQRVADVEDLRHFVAFGARQQPVAQSGRIERGARARHHDGVDDLAQPLVGHAGAQRRRDVGMLGQQIVDLERRDLDAAARDDVLGAADERDEAVLVADARDRRS